MPPFPTAHVLLGIVPTVCTVGYKYGVRLADFENARKRLLRDAETERKYASEPLVRDLLPTGPSARTWRRWE